MYSLGWLLTNEWEFKKVIFVPLNVIAIPPASDSDATTLAPGVTENPEESTEPSVSAEPGQVNIDTFSFIS